MSTGASKNPKVKAQTILNAGTDREHTEDEAREFRIKKRFQAAEKFTKTTDILAQDSIHQRNFFIPKGKEWFPQDWKFQMVDMFYPYAKGGPLYIDMPGTIYEVKFCEDKLKAYREKGLRYTYLKNGEGAYEGQLRLDGQDPDKIKADQEKLHSAATASREL